MVQGFQSQNSAQVNRAQQESMTSDDENMEENTLQSGRYVPVFGIVGTKKKTYAPGYGFRSRDQAEGYADFDFVDSGTNNITGKARWVLYESTDREVPAVIGEAMNIQSLRNSKSASLTDKLIHPGKIPAAGEDAELVLELNVDSANDGNDYSKSNSSVDQGLPYSEFRTP